MGGLRISDDEKSDILFFYKNNASVERIAENMGIKESRVKYVIKRYNVEKPWYCKILNWLGVSYG